MDDGAEGSGGGLVLATMIALAVACGASGEGGACTFTVTFRGVDYDGINIAIEPSPGRVVGTATLPPCNDANGVGGGQGDDLTVAELQGVPPEAALVISGWDDTILVREGVDPMPAEVQRLMTAPPCLTSDEPLRIGGPWLGILAANGQTERDLEPPYDLNIRVSDASSDRYVHALESLRVPASLGRPITRKDVDDALRKDGSIEATVHCEGDRFVADRVRVIPSG